MLISQLLGLAAAVTTVPGTPLIGVVNHSLPRSLSMHRQGVLTLDREGGVLEVWAVKPDVVRIDFRPAGVHEKPTVLMDPTGLRTAAPVGEVKGGVLETSEVRVVAENDELRISDKKGHRWLTIPMPETGAGISLRHASNENLYGMRSYSTFPRGDLPKQEQGLLRNLGAPVAAGTQGDGGAPLAYTSHWGVLVDSIDGRFINRFGNLTFSGGSRKSLEAYVVLGSPKSTISAVTLLSGRPSMPPKWSLGFMNSEWGTTQQEVESTVAEYRRRQIPIDAFILDFDFKAWGEDNFGEFRWNSTNGLGAVQGNKFPDGASGKFAGDLAKQGIKLVGIMKPRVLVKNTKGEMTAAAKEIDAHHWWLPGRKPYDDYFSHRQAGDLDYSTAEARNWYWKHSEPLFKTGIVGWWNDEADDNFPTLGFFQMQQSLYEGQRSISNLRVFSLNRNFYLGAQRYGYGVWSGDIGTGYNVMASQRARMLTMVGLAEPHWSMDTGGFGGHPTPDVYARWMEFASVVPIMRVHGTFNEQRQPWVYGPVAEKAATDAIRWRYSMMPSFYSWEREAHETGVGTVRPMHWEFPDDPECANRIDEWMLGDGLLVSPVVAKEEAHEVYLPNGRWFALDSDKEYLGGQTVTLPTDSQSWRDVPKFVRSGTILATQAVEQYVGEKSQDVLTLDVWSDPDRVARFDIYDDDGSTYAYEQSRYFSQTVTSFVDKTNQTHLVFGKRGGRMRCPYRTYRIRLHQGNMKVSELNFPAPADGKDLTLAAK